MRNQAIDDAAQRIAVAKESKRKRLDLRNCGIHSLEEYFDLWEMHWLEELALGNGGDEGLGFSNGEQGTTSNTFEVIPAYIAGLNKLKVLDLSGMALDETSRPLLIHALPDSLKQLSINDTFLSEDTNPKFLNLAKLKVFYARGSKLSQAQLQHMGPALESLLQLDLSENDLDDEPLAEALKSMGMLALLVLDSNRIGPRTLRTLDRPEGLLATLSLSNCGITNVELLLLTNLKVGISLDLSYNQINDLHHLKNTGARYLNLSYCGIEQIADLLHFEGTETVVLEGNPIKDCPSDIWETGNLIQIRAYFKSKHIDKKGKVDAKTKSKPLAPMAQALENDVIGINEPGHKTGADMADALSKSAEPPYKPKRDVKLILLGNSAAGKTNFVHYLKTGGFLGQRKSTHGLSVEYWIPDMEKYPSLENIGVSIWDFGGQEYYHDAYRLFLSSNAVYVLLWSEDTNANGYSAIALHDNEKPVQLAHYHLEYWLDTIRTKRGKNAPLMVVQNKTDLHGKKRLDQDLHSEYEIDDSFHISLMRGGAANNSMEHKEVQFLLEHLYQHMARIADEAEYGDGWLKLREELRDFGQQDEGMFYTLELDEYGGVELNEFLVICSLIVQRDVSEDEAYTLPRWLDRCGVITYIDSPALRNKVFLNPLLLTKKLYTDLHADLLDRSGHYEPNPDSIKTIELLKSLDMVIEHRSARNGSTSYIVPQYLPDTHAIEDLFKIASDKRWPHSIWLLVPIFAYRKMLTSIISKYFKSEQIESRYFWKHGILFRRDESLVLIKGLPDEGGSHCAVIQVSLEQGQNEKDSSIGKTVFKDLLDLYEACSHPYEDEREARRSSMNKVDFAHEKRMQLKEKFLQRLLLSYDGIHFASYTEISQRIAERKTWIETSVNLKPADSIEKSRTRDVELHPFGKFLNLSVTKTKRVFLSYSHNNTHWLNRLMVHLSGLRHSDIINHWTDQLIMPGERWDDRIREEISNADVFILLLSADFIASQYIWNEELPAIQKQLVSKSKQFIPVLIEPFDLGAVGPIAVKEAIPKDAEGKLKALSLWNNQEEGLMKVAERIRMAIGTEVLME